jgi:heat shock protein HtpX
MAMNFWQAQQKARSRTSLFVILFVILTAIMSAMVEISMRVFVPEYDHNNPLPWLGIGFMGITFLVAIFQYMKFSTVGGRYVPESLGAHRVDARTASYNEQKLLNIVEEMAVAAGLPMPPVYILPANQINAFAAGMTPQDAAVTVTQGTLDRLNRDELQGVIAHELGHIYNGDVKISMRLAAMVMGFFFVLYIGLRIIQFSSFRGRGNGNGNRRGQNPVAIAALLFIIAGAFTWFFGSILKSAVSREREYLADACAVQFTRNPLGIANALRKIEKESSADMPPQGNAYSHLYFNDLSFFSSLFQTHPPIKKRIAAILGGRYEGMKEVTEK